MNDFGLLAQEAVLALARIGNEAAQSEGPEEALWCVTRCLPTLLGDASAALAPNAFREQPPNVVGCAAAAFLRMPDGRHHLIAAPVNFPAEQHHELVDINLGHPGEVARHHHPLLLRDTTVVPSFVKILQAFRAGSSMFAPMLWQGRYLGVIICANAARRTFGERDLAVHTAFAALAAALFVAQGGPAWLERLDTTGLPVRTTGT
jgi:GAF domain-containing protein